MGLNPLSMMIVAMIAIPLGFALRQWYAKDPQRSLLVLCILLALVSPWAALMALVLAKAPIFVLRVGKRTEGN
jgi:hypothetical protein